MIKLILTLLPFLWNILSQLEIGEYIHVRKGSHFFLTINQDSTFVYLQPAVFNGTVKETGRWKIHQNNLVLLDSVGFVKSKSGVVGKKNISQKFVSINFLDENGKPLGDLEIGVTDNKLYKRTDS